MAGRPVSLLRPASASTSRRLTYAQIEALWIKNGGKASLAPVMAAIAMAESGGRTDAHNPNPPDDSYGLWQINYYGDMRAGRTKQFGSPAQLLADPNLQAKAAIALEREQGLDRAWSTYHYGNYLHYLDPSATPDPTGLPAGGGAPGVDVTAAASMVADTSGCLVSIPVVGCVMSKGQGRAVLGALLLTGGAIVGGAGLIVLAAYGLQRTGALDQAAKAASVVPGAGGVAATLRTASTAAQGRPRPGADKARAAKRSAARARVEARRGAGRERIAGDGGEGEGGGS